MSRLKIFFKDKIVSILQKKLNIKNRMAVPCVQKITLNMGVGEASRDKKHIKTALEDLLLISGQKAVTTFSKKSVASFKIREGWPIGVKVTLRGRRMYDFLDRLISVTIPRIRDFRGLNLRSFDSNGNYNFGIKEHISFLEINYDKVDKIRGLDIAITTSSSTKKECEELLRCFNFPLKF